MSDTTIAKLFRNGRSQAVRLPMEFRFNGDQVRVRRVGSGIILEPILSPGSWFAELDGLGQEPFMTEGRNQPVTPTGQDLL